MTTLLNRESLCQHRFTEWFWLEGTSWGHMVKPPSEGGQLDQVVQGYADISVSPRAVPLGACYSVWPPPWWRYFSLYLINICLSILTTCACCPWMLQGCNLTPTQLTVQLDSLQEPFLQSKWYLNPMERQMHRSLDYLQSLLESK